MWSLDDTIPSFYCVAGLAVDGGIAGGSVLSKLIKGGKGNQQWSISPPLLEYITAMDNEAFSNLRDQDTAMSACLNCLQVCFSVGSSSLFNWNHTKSEIALAYLKHRA